MIFFSLPQRSEDVPSKKPLKHLSLTRAVIPKLSRRSTKKWLISTQTKRSEDSKAHSQSQSQRHTHPETPVLIDFVDLDYRDPQLQDPSSENLSHVILLEKNLEKAESQILELQNKLEV